MPKVGSQIITDEEIMAAGTWGIDWTDQLATGETIASVVIAVNEDDCDGTDVTATVCPAGGVIDATKKLTTCEVLGTAMSPQKYYYVHHKITTTGGNIFEDYYLVQCRNC